MWHLYVRHINTLDVREKLEFRSHVFLKVCNLVSSLCSSRLMVSPMLNVAGPVNGSYYPFAHIWFNILSTNYTSAVILHCIYLPFMSIIRKHSVYFFVISLKGLGECWSEDPVIAYRQDTAWKDTFKGRVSLQSEGFCWFQATLTYLHNTLIQILIYVHKYHKILALC